MGATIAIRRIYGGGDLSATWRGYPRRGSKHVEVSMAETYWESVVYREEPLWSLDRCDESEVFGWMAANLPVLGTKVDWSRVEGSHEHWDSSDGNRAREAALAAVRARFDGRARALHAGDDLLELDPSQSASTTHS